MAVKLKRVVRYAIPMGIVLLLASVFIGYQWFMTAMVVDQERLVLASFLQDEVSGLRAPLYFTVEGLERPNPTDLPLVGWAPGRDGGCGYLAYIGVVSCQAFAVSPDILRRGEILSRLLTFLDDPCARIAKDAESVPRADGKSIEELRLQSQERRRRERQAVASAFFGCQQNEHKSSTLIINIVDGLDEVPKDSQGTRLRDKGSRAIRFQIVTQY